MAGLKKLISELFKNSFWRFLIVGGTSYVIDVGLLFILYRIFDLPIWLATAIAFLTSFLFNFFLQRAFVFESNTRKRVAFVKYVLLVIFNTFATVIIVTSFENPFGWVQAKTLAVALSMGWNYFAYKYLIFRKTTSTQSV